MKDDRFYLIHILECIARVEEYSREGRDFFFADHRTQDAIMRNLHILTESSQRISPGLRQAHPEVNWRDLAAFRNVAVHNYLTLDLVRVWDVIAENLPELETQLEAILSSLPS